MVYTSLKKIFAMGSWLHETPEFEILMKSVNKDYTTMDDANISFHKIVELTNLEYAIDCTESRKDLSNTWREYSVWCASLIEEHITESECKDAIAAARKYLLGEIDAESLKPIYKAAYHARCFPKNDLAEIQDSANSCAVNTVNSDIEHCIQYGYLNSGYGLLELGWELADVNSLQENKFLEITS